jgi:hypothetical protein
LCTKARFSSRLAHLQSGRMDAAYRAKRPRRTSSQSPKVVCGSFQEVCFCFALLFSPSPITSHCIAFQPHDRRSARAQKSHSTPPSWTQGFSHRSRSEKSGQQHLPAHLPTLESENSKETPRSEAVCATSRRNNLSIAPKHSTSLRIVAPTPGSPASRHRTSIHPLQNPSKTPFEWGVTLQMLARVLSSVARHWRDTSKRLSCCATLRAKKPLRDYFRVALHCFLFLCF